MKSARSSVLDTDSRLSFIASKEEFRMAMNRLTDNNSHVGYAESEIQEGQRRTHLIHGHFRNCFAKNKFKLEDTNIENAGIRFRDTSKCQHSKHVKSCKKNYDRNNREVGQMSQSNLNCSRENDNLLAET